MNVEQSLIELPSDLVPEKMPRHVAVIMDGNGRWAKKTCLTPCSGTSKGC